jgi:hypothetical protein
MAAIRSERERETGTDGRYSAQARTEASEARIGANYVVALRTHACGHNAVFHPAVPKAVGRAASPPRKSIRSAQQESYLPRYSPLGIRIGVPHFGNCLIAATVNNITPK